MRVEQPRTTQLSELTIDTDLDLASHKLLTTNLSFFEYTSDAWKVQNRAHSAYKQLYFGGGASFGDLLFWSDGLKLQAGNSDGDKLLFQARDSGVGAVSVARLVGAADPYLEATLPMVLNPSALPGTLVEGHFGYSSAAKKPFYRDDAGTRYINRTETKVKAGDETVNNSNTLQDDDDLVLAIAANDKWMLRCVLYLVQGNDAGADFQFSFTVPAAATAIFGGRASLSGSQVVAGGSATAGNGISINIAANDVGIIVLDCLVVNGGNAGNVTLQWAQVTAAAVDTIVKAGSCLVGYKL